MQQLLGAALVGSVVLALSSGCGASHASTDADVEGNDADFHTAWDAGWDVECPGGTVERDVVVDELADLVELRGYSIISGYFRIDDTSAENLRGLECLLEIRGHFSVTSNDSLATLDGLESLTMIGGGFVLQSNATLDDLSALRRIQSFGDNVEIRRNEALGSLDGLDSLISIDGALLIEDNESLESVAALASLASVDVLSITRNRRLPQCAAEALVERLRSQGWTGEATVALNDESAPCD